MLLLPTFRLHPNPVPSTWLGWLVSQPQGTVSLCTCRGGGGGGVTSDHLHGQDLGFSGAPGPPAHGDLRRRGLDSFARDLLLV